VSGLVALGDSITNGHGEPAIGVHPQSWAQWLAEALDMPFLKLATDGATTGDVLAQQMPRLRAAAAPHASSAPAAPPFPAAAGSPGAPVPDALHAPAATRFALACVYAGVNDVRGIDWDPAAYERDLRAIVAAVCEHADCVLVCTLPHDLGRPRAAPKPAQAGAVVRGLAAEAGAIVVDLDDLAGPPLLLPDAVHPTALGQLEIAARAAAALRAAGVAVPRDPRDLADVHDSRRAAARHRARLAILLARDLRRRAVERVVGVR
jgi:lysophospholipase L1-like esterase